MCGATMHMTAVGPNCDPEPVHSLGTLTGELHGLGACSLTAV